MSDLKGAAHPLDESFLSTRDVASALGVSEATVKRWSDDGLITCRRTPGGHRKFTREDVDAFVRTHHFASPESIAPPPSLAPEEVVRLAIAGDARVLHRTVSAALQRGLPLADLLDLHLAPAMLEVGEQWACAGLTVAEEHLVSTTITTVLAQLAEELGRETNRGVAVAACLAGERHDIGLRMASLVLRAKGFKVLSTGADTPVADVARLGLARHADVFLVSGVLAVNRPRERLEELLRELRGSACRVVVGGAAFVALGALPPGAELGANMRELERLIDAARPQVA